MQIHLVSHTHWDREWYLTFEQFRLRLVDLVDRLLDQLESQPDFAHFHLDGQTIVLEDYLELRPHNEARLRRLIADGRILIGPWYDMPDEFLVSGEALVRNLALGHRIARRFGAPMPVGYLPDLFGHVAQMPQILRNFGLDNAILWRGFGGEKAEYWWQAPDGSRVLMMHLPPEGYCNATRVHLDPAAMLDRATTAARTEAERTVVGEVLLMNGVDHVEPHPVIPELVRQMSAALGVPVRHSTLPAYVDAVRAGVGRNGIAESLAVVHGELRGGEEYANLLPGVFSARTYLKQANARVQTLLEKRAEPLATFASMLGARYPREELRYAWKLLLQNHPHDSICGCSVDAVHEENMTRFARAGQVAGAIADQAATVVARAVPAAPPGAVRLVAINTTGTPFRGTMEAFVELPYESAEPRRVFDAAALDVPVTFWPQTLRPIAVSSYVGGSLPLQVLGEEDVVTFVMSRYETPWALRARRLRLAFYGEVPACGYAAFDIAMSEASATPANHLRQGFGGREAGGYIPSASGTTPAKAGGYIASASGTSSVASGFSRTDHRSAKNGHVSISINDDGTVDLVDGSTGTCYPRCGALEDVGDVGDEYNYSPPAGDRRVTSADAIDVKIAQVQAGPVRVVFQIDYVLLLPSAASADRGARGSETTATPVRIMVSLDADSSRVGWHVTVDNHSQDHRLRLLFPVGVDSITEVRAETAFGVATRPARREVPAVVRVERPVSYGPTGYFTEAGDDTCGAIVMGDGLTEYEAYTEDGPARLALTLLRCVGFLSREDLVTRPSGHAGPGLATPGAQCLGRHEFRAAFEPRQRRPTNASLFASASSFVAPPLMVVASGTGGELAGSGSFIDVDTATGAGTGAIVLSACQRSEDGTHVQLRVFNPDPLPATVSLSVSGKTTSAATVDFLDQPMADLPVADGAATLTVRGHGIATIRLNQ